MKFFNKMKVSNNKTRFFSIYDWKMWMHIIFRFVLLILGIAVIGLYAQDLNRANKEGKYSDGKWVSCARAHSRLESL